jgi:hypothetical protein
MRHDGRNEERQVRVLPLHWIQGEVRKYLYTRRTTCRITREVVKPVQISDEVAVGIATALRASAQEAAQQRVDDQRQIE